MLQKYVPEKYQWWYWVGRLTGFIFLVIIASYSLLYFGTDLNTIEQINAMGIISSSVLTVALIVIYRDMKLVQRDQVSELVERRKAQEKVVDIQQSQEKIQSQQTNILEKQANIQSTQTDLLRGQNRPYVSLDIDYIHENTFVVEAINEGSGIARSIHLGVKCFVFIEQLRQIGDQKVEWSDDDVEEEVHTERNVIELKNVSFSAFERGKMKNALRPGKDTYKSISLSPEDGTVGGYITPKLDVIYKGEYQEATISEFVGILQNIGIEELTFQFEYQYNSLSDIRYYGHLMSRNVNITDVSNLEDLAESSQHGFVINSKTRPEYYEKLE